MRHLAPIYFGLASVREFETYDDNSSNENKLTNTKRVDGVFTSSAHVAQLNDYASGWLTTISGETVSSAVYIEEKKEPTDQYYENRPSAALNTYADYNLQDHFERYLTGRAEVMTSMSKAFNDIFIKSKSRSSKIPISHNPVSTM